MKGSPSQGIRPNLNNSTPTGTAQRDDSHEASLSPIQRQGAQSPEQEDSPVSSRPILKRTPGQSDKGKGKAKATDNTEADASDRSSSKADSAAKEKHASSLKKKVSFILPALAHRSPSPVPPVPQNTSSSRIFQGGFYIQRAPRTPARTSNFSQSHEETEPAAALTTPIRRSDQSFSSELSPLAPGNSVTLNQASHPAGILRNRKPLPIRVLSNTTASSVFPPDLPYGVQDDRESEPGSPDPFFPRVRSRQAHEVTEESPLRQSMSAIYSQPPPEQPGDLLAAHGRSDKEKELKAGKTKSFRSLFKSSKNLERSSKELDNNNQQGQAQTNIVSSNPRLSPQSPTVKSPFLSGNSFKNLYKRSPSSSESLLPTSSKHQSRIVAAMDNNQENQETEIQAAGEEINEQASSDSSSSSSGFLTSMDPLPEDQVIDIRQGASWMQYGSNLPHPVFGNSQASQNAMNYTDREYGRYYLGYTGLQDGVPSGVDSLLSIGGYGRRLRTFALNASNERFRHFKYYKSYEVEQWIEQQLELFWPVRDDLSSQVVQKEDLKKAVGFEEPLRKRVRSLPDLRSAWELSKPYDAAISYKLPPSSYPLKKFVYPEEALSFEPHERYVAASQGSHMSHVEKIDPFELNIDLSSVVDNKQEDVAGEEVDERSIAREYASQFAVQHSSNQDARQPESFEASHEDSHIDRSSQAPAQRHILLDLVDDYLASDAGQETDLHITVPSDSQRDVQTAVEIVHENRERNIVQRINAPNWIFEDSDDGNTTRNHQEQDPHQPHETPERDIVQRLNDLDWAFEDSEEDSVNGDRQGQQDLNQAHEAPQRDIDQRSDDSGWIFDDSDEASMNNGPQQQREPDPPYQAPERDIVQRLNDIDWMFEDSDEESLNNDHQGQQNPETQEIDNTMASTNSVTTQPVLISNFTRRSCERQTRLIPLILAPHAHLPQTHRSSTARLSSSASPAAESTSFVAENNSTTQHQHTSQSNIPISRSARDDDSPISDDSQSTKRQEEYLLGLRGGGLEENRIKRMISGIPSKFKKLIPILNTKRYKDMSRNKNGKSPVHNIASYDVGNIDHQIEETSDSYTMVKTPTTPRKSVVFKNGQETSVSPESSYYKSPDAIILSNGSIVPTSSDGYAIARFCKETFTQAPRVNSSHGDIRRIVPLNLNKSLPMLPKVEDSADGKIPNSRAWVEKAFEVSAELERRRLLGSPVTDQSDLTVIKKAATDTAATAAKLANLEKRISELERTGGGA